MNQNSLFECGGFYFIHNFDSGNLGHVERVPTEHIVPFVNPKNNATETPDYEFNLWTRPDCAGTEFENSNRTWFYFGIQAAEPGVLVRLNLINLNKQGKMYNQGMAPVTRTLPGKPQWERIRDKPVHTTDENAFTLSFKYRTAENVKATTFFAFTYPYSFAELQISLNSIDLKMLPIPPAQSLDDLYYCRECLIYSLEGRRVDLLTITSHHGITTEREERLKNLFPDNQERPFKFNNKKVIFMSARVHPGETPSSFVFNGFLNLLLNRNDPIAIHLRKLYVFKLVPFLNPDGVARGHYRTDTRGVNLNRVYLNPSLAYHPTVYASRALIRYYHYGCEKEDNFEDNKSFTSRSMHNISESSEILGTMKKKKSPTSNASSSFNYKRPDKSKAVGTSGSQARSKPSNVDGQRAEREKSLSGEAANLADQVCELKLQELTSQTSATSSRASVPNIPASSSLLNEQSLRSYLGSDVRLSASSELNIQGNNPLKPLRDTLKDSISLLIAGDSSVSDKESRQSNIKMGWCSECRRSVAQLEASIPGITSMVPGYSATLMKHEPLMYHTIDEYREHQMQQINDQEKKVKDKEPLEGEDVYFCTNCFKRYLLAEGDEEIKLVPCSGGNASPTAGDCGDSKTGQDVETIEKEITIMPPVPVAPTPKEEKVTPKSPMSRIAVKKPTTVVPLAASKVAPRDSESGLFLYIDLHGHASKKGIFMYGNHFEDVENSVECMLLPRIMSLNNLHFHFSSCNFTERNMYLKDRRDGMSREGSGRVAVLKATGLVRSYTLECNYNTGRLVNVLPPAVKEGQASQLANNHTVVPPKYTPHIFEEMKHYRAKHKVEIFEEIDPFQVGRSLGSSILDLTSHHPNSRIPCSEHRNLPAVREWLRAHTKSIRPQLTMSRLRPKATSPSRLPLYARSKVTDERKENTYVVPKTDSERRRSPPILAQRSGHDIVNMNLKYVKKSEPVKTSTSKTRYLTENEPKPKTLSTKRRNILSIRKPNTSKTQVGGIVKAKLSRRSVEDSDNVRVSTKMGKRIYSRSLRGSGKIDANRCRTMASSSSEDIMIGGNWEDVAGGTVLGSQAGGALQDASGASKRRPFPNPSPSRLKKIRLKTVL